MKKIFCLCTNCLSITEGSIEEDFHSVDLVTCNNCKHNFTASCFLEDAILPLTCKNLGNGFNERLFLPLNFKLKGNR